jgi:membrane protease YdiL (CAAX protease family)
MLQNSSKKEAKLMVEPAPRRSWRFWVMIVALPLWVLIGFLGAQVLAICLVWILHMFHIPLSSINPTLFETIVSAVIYIFTIAIVIGLPWLIKKRRTTVEDIGLHRLPYWRDMLMAPVGLVVYLIISFVLLMVVSAIVPGFNITQQQVTGFTGITQQYELILAFMTLVVVAPVAEEVLFRGYLLGKLRKLFPTWAAILATSILFGLIHVGTTGAWNVAVDTFALSIVLSLLRISTGSIWASMLLHMIKNGIAFYILFVNPILNSTIGG